ncbi:hypothetical protein P5V15_014123 [Pogonomyrmex californicus]
MDFNGNFGRDPPIFDDRAAAGASDDDFDVEVDDIEVREFMDSPAAQNHFRCVREWLWIVNQFYCDGVFLIGEDSIRFVVNGAGRTVELPWSMELYELLICMPEAVSADIEVDDSPEDDPLEDLPANDEDDMGDDPAANPAQARDRSPGA